MDGGFSPGFFHLSLHLTRQQAISPYELLILLAFAEQGTEMVLQPPTTPPSCQHKRTASFVLAEGLIYQDDSSCPPDLFFSWFRLSLNFPKAHRVRLG